MKVVKNSMVEMQWNADGFIETKRLGFISAVHQYGNVPVAFRDGKIYTHISEEGNVISFKDLVGAIKGAVKEKDADYPYFYEDYAEIYDGKDFVEGTINFLGIDDSKEDMLDRINDLSGYWVVTETNSL
ncbi:hypothetical protein ACEE21_14790 [Clostridium baratii]